MASSAAATSNTLPMSWCDLPPDLFGQILRRLTSCKDGVRLSEVCRHWRVCARQHFPGRCQILPMRVTRTAHGTRVVHVRGFSTLQEQHLPLCQPSRSAVGEHRRRRRRCVGGFVDSPPFAAGGLDWAIRYYPGSDYGGDDRDGNRGHVGVFVRLLTKGAVAWARVGLRVLDQTTGLADDVVWDERRPMLFHAAADRRARGTGKLATRSHLKRSGGFVRGDCLKIECVLDAVCRVRMLK